MREARVSCIQGGCHTGAPARQQERGTERKEEGGQGGEGRRSEGLLAGLDLVFWATAHVKRLKERCVAAGAATRPGPGIGPSTTHVIAPRSMSVSAIASHLYESDPVSSPFTASGYTPHLADECVCGWGWVWEGGRKLGLHRGGL